MLPKRVSASAPLKGWAADASRFTRDCSLRFIAPALRFSVVERFGHSACASFPSGLWHLLCPFEVEGESSLVLLRDQYLKLRNLGMAPSFDGVFRPELLQDAAQSLRVLRR